MLGLFLGLIVSMNPPPAEDFEALRKEYDAKLQAVESRYVGNEVRKVDQTKVDWVARYREWPGWTIAPRMLAYAEAHSGEPDAASALFWVAERVGNVGDNDRVLLPVVARALEILARSHVADPRIDGLCRAISFSGGSSRSLDFLRQVADHAKDRGVRARALLGVARGLTTRASIARNPWFDQSVKSPIVMVMMERISEAYVKEIRQFDPDALDREAVSLYERLTKEYADVPADMRKPEHRTIAKVSQAELNELRFLGIGQTAPEIEGRDADDKPFKLSDYRGKVVILTFSGNWCGPCVGMYPNERRMVEAHKDKPFAILSVNTDETRETLKKAIQDREITWRCWWDGPDRPICDDWAVKAFPTVYLIDAKGVIRKKGLRDEPLELAVEALLKESSRAPGP